MNPLLRLSMVPLILLAVGPAFLVGIAVMSLHGAPLSMPLMNLGAVLVGFLFVGFGSAALLRLTSERAVGVAIAVLVGMASTFLAEGLEGVHRWVRLGPVRLHPSAMFSPLLLLALVVLWQRGKTALTLLFFATAWVLHIAQPDAGQATALAASALVLVAIPDKRMVARIVIGVGAIAGAAAAWMRPDPLAPVAMVEDIVPHALAKHVLLGLAAVVALALLPGATFLRAKQSRTNPQAWAYGVSLTAYFVASIGVVALGEFPTPVLGFGASPILGAILGLGLLARSAEAN